MKFKIKIQFESELPESGSVTLVGLVEHYNGTLYGNDKEYTLSFEHVWELVHALMGLVKSLPEFIVLDVQE